MNLELINNLIENGATTSHVDKEISKHLAKTLKSVKNCPECNVLDGMEVDCNTCDGEGVIFVSRSATSVEVTDFRNSLSSWKVRGKAEKSSALKRVTVTTKSGKEFYGDADSRIDIIDAIDLSERTGQKTAPWKLVTGEEMVSVDELREARILALRAKGNIVGITS